MPTLKVLWTNVSHQQFNQLRQRAVDANHLSEFIMAHNEIVAILRDLDQATARGDPLYRTKKPGGVAYHFFHAPIFTDLHNSCGRGSVLDCEISSGAYLMA